MPTITNPPIGVDLVNGSESGQNDFHPTLIRISDSVYYLIQVSYVVGAGTLRAYKSIDGGSTWVEKDTANKPLPGNQSGFFFVFDDTVPNHVIGILYRDGTSGAPGTNLYITTFDTNTDLWGTPSAAFDLTPIPDHANITRFCFYRQTGGTWVAISAKISFGPTVGRIYYITSNGSTWSGTTNLTTTNVAFDVWGGIRDSSDNYYFLADNGSFGMLFFKVDVVFTLSSPISLTPPAMFIGNPASTPSLVLYGPDSIAVSFTTTNGDVRVFIGTPLAAPVFTTYIIYTNVLSEVTKFSTVMVDQSGALNAFFILFDDDQPTDPAEAYIGQSVFDGATFGAVTVFYDELLNPPPGGPQEAFHKLDVIQPAAGGWIATTAMGAAGEEQNVQFILLAPPLGPTSQTLELTKVVSGGPASPSDFGLSATGGSPEVTISGNGHVGPTEVSPGTYELAEVDASSAQWGTAIWGESLWGGNYAQGAWDCGGAFMPTPTSVVVAPGSGGSPYIAATQVASDPTYRAFLSGGKYEFHIGAYVYQVLFNSAGKLGVFRRAAVSSGSSWTLMDAVHAPGSLSGNGQVTQSGTTIAIAYLESGNSNMRIVEFSTVTDTYGTPTIAKAMLSTLATFAFVRRSDNTYVIVAGRPNTIYLVTNTGGLWSGFTILASLLSGAAVLSGVIDSSDRIWTLINTASSTVGIYSISASYALGSAIDSVSVLFPGLPFPYLYYPRISLWGTDGVAVAWNTALTIGGAGTISVKTITPLAAPVVTTSVAYTFGAGTERAFLFQPVDDGSGNLDLFFVDTDTGVNQILQALFDGSSTWGSTSTFYDATTDPPPNPASPSDISALQPLKLAAGWAAAATMQTTGDVSTGEFIEVVNPTNTVACQIVNTFIPTPPPPPPPGGGGENAVGCFELLRVDVTLTPSKKLPSRGSVK